MIHRPMLTGLLADNQSTAATFDQQSLRSEQQPKVSKRASSYDTTNDSFACVHLLLNKTKTDSVSVKLGQYLIERLRNHNGISIKQLLEDSIVEVKSHRHTIADCAERQGFLKRRIDGSLRQFRLIDFDNFEQL